MSNQQIADEELRDRLANIQLNLCIADDEANYAGQIVLAICNVLEGNGSGNTDFREIVEGYCDNGIYNLTKLKESLKEK